MTDNDIQTLYSSLNLSRLGRCVIFGGTGFIGRHIARRLSDAGVPVTVVSRHAPKPGLLPPSVVWREGQIQDAESVLEACRDAQTVFHTASTTQMNGAWDDFLRCNVTGTRHILQACQCLGIPRLVYTSTPSVVTGGGDILNGDESLPYHASQVSGYARSKQLAEQELLAANSATLQVTALRPHLVWGDDDPHILPVLAKAHRAGRLRCIGNGRNVVSLTHVENAAYGHIAAALELSGDARCAGKPYFICDDTPVNLWTWIDTFLQTIGLPPLRRHIPAGLAYALAACAEAAAAILPGRHAPVITRFVVRQVSTSHSFRSDAAKRDFGYRTIVSNDEGLGALQRNFL